MWINGSIPLLIFQILIGYWFLSRRNSKKIELSELTGYRTTYESAISGIAITLLSTALVGICVATHWVFTEVSHPIQFPPVFIKPLTSHFDVTRDITAIVILSVLVALVGPKVINRRLPFRQVQEKHARESGLLPSLILDSLATRLPVEIVIAQREVYVGWVRRGPSITRSGKMDDVAILPSHRGYMKEDTTIHLHTEYLHGVNWDLLPMDRPDLSDKSREEVLEIIGDESSVVLKLDDITSIRYFSVRDVEEFIEVGEPGRNPEDG